MTAPPDNHAAAERPPTARLGVWHLVWTLVVLAGFAGVNAVAGGLTVSQLVVLGAGLAPSLAVLIIRRFDSGFARFCLLALWAVCGAVAAILTGGMGGPMALWCLAPLAVSAVLPGRSYALAGGLSVLAVVNVVLAQVTGNAPAAPTGMAAFVLGLTAMAAMALGLVQSLVAAASRSGRSAAPAPVASPATAPDLDAMPGKLLIINADDIIASAAGGLTVPGSQAGAPIVLMARAEERAGIAEALATARSGAAATLEFTPEGDATRHMSLDLAPAKDGRVLALVRDASVARAREEALELARSDAENLAAGRARFLAGMSHELRTPLNAIMGFSDIMKNKMFGDLPPKYAEYADLIHESGAHLLDLINDVLDMSKIEAHRYELHKEFMDAREPVSAALRILRVQADTAGVKLRATLPPEQIEVDADRRAIKQIVINLVSNALKFTPRDGSVIVGMIRRGRDLDLTVADTGIGIAPDDLQRIGKPYEQAGDASRKVSGTGLGLSLVRAFAELHGGQMVIESRLGEGTAVTVTMPVVVVDEAGAESANPDNVVAFKPQR